jgi:hypothetical protein
MPLPWDLAIGRLDLHFTPILKREPYIVLAVDRSEVYKAEPSSCRFRPYNAPFRIGFDRFTQFDVIQMIDTSYIITHAFADVNLLVNTQHMRSSI